MKLIFPVFIVACFVTISSPKVFGQIPGIPGLSLVFDSQNLQQAVQAYEQGVQTFEQIKAQGEALLVGQWTPWMTGTLKTELKSCGWKPKKIPGMDNLPKIPDYTSLCAMMEKDFDQNLSPQQAKNLGTFIEDWEKKGGSIFPTSKDSFAQRDAKIFNRRLAAQQYAKDLTQQVALYEAGNPTEKLEKFVSELDDFKKKPEKDQKESLLIAMQNEMLLLLIQEQMQTNKLLSQYLKLESVR